MSNEAKPCPCDIGDRMEYGGLGQEVQIEHLRAYVVKPSAPSDKAVIVIHDIYGWELPNTRYMADMLADSGYITVLPDFFVGKEPWTQSHDWAILEEWLKERSPTNTSKEVDAVLRFLKEQCGARRFGVVGFCWGGIATHYLSLNYAEIKVGVSLYGIIRDREDRYGLKFPTLFIFAGNDFYIPLDQVNVLEARLKEKCTTDHHVKIFPGQTHGFVHRKNEDMNPEDKPSILEARADLLNWLKKYI
ncbi:carboxymethylenebutenolidase homolog [Cheilinus undulatus]|uniref:carboxymethylenebutenolidase homolog n=1 Tax=Cheilinus undulatus TaxID=241271 RepID=UPI001BD619DD|nr:carboxymethylenebutenolidase homolog [Cheilinus undulatus]XP_041670142.1 carboxymethylenebutenolidase homolog [Cheilinus undulatus]